MAISSIILAGGKSSRFGQNKFLETIGNKTLIQRVVDCVALLGSEIIIVTARGEVVPCSSSVEMKTVGDVYPEKGPLGGIYSGLIRASNPQAVVVGSDMPFINVELLRYMHRISHAFDAVVPRIQDKVEPLCAIYSKKCCSVMQELLEQNELRINRLFDVVKVRYVSENEINRFDPEHLSFFNINTRADLGEAREIAARQAGEA